MKGRMGMVLACSLGLSGCVLMPPMPYGRALLTGQNESQSGLNMAFRPGTIHHSYVEGGYKRIIEDSYPEQFAAWPVNWYLGSSHGVGRSGSEWGWQLTVPSIEPAVYFRQALRRPVDPMATAWALQLDGIYGIPYYYSLSVALAGTKRLSTRWEGTLAVRTGATRYPIWGPSKGWGPSLEGNAALNFVDASVALGHLGPNGRFSVEGVMRLPMSGSQLIYDYSYTEVYSPPYNTSRSTSELIFEPAYFLALRTSLYDFTSYVAQALALPRQWTPRASPDTIPSEQRLKLAAELASAGMPADAADEYQTALRMDPDLDKAHAPLSEIYMQLGEWELAHYHAQRAHEIDPNDKRAAEVLRRIEATLKSQR